MQGLRDVAEHGEVVHRVESLHGGNLSLTAGCRCFTEEGRRRFVRTIWIIAAGEDAPRCVTPIPARNEPR
jgi:hypothetical protein